MEKVLGKGPVFGDKVDAADRSPWGFGQGPFERLHDPAWNTATHSVNAPIYKKLPFDGDASNGNGMGTHLAFAWPPVGILGMADLPQFPPTQHFRHAALLPTIGQRREEVLKEGVRLSSGELQGQPARPTH